MGNMYTAMPVPPKADLEAHYNSGLTQEEVGHIYGVSQRQIWKWFKRLGIKSRAQVKRNQWGANNSSWKGAEATYAAFHYRVQAVRGTPNFCEHCKSTDPQVRYEWASVSLKYDDVNDYIRLCKRCHIHYDGVPAKSSATQRERRSRLVSN